MHFSTQMYVHHYIPTRTYVDVPQVYTSVEVTFASPGGHSSMPPTDGSDVASQMARFISHIK